MKTTFSFLLMIFTLIGYGQLMVTRDIKSFGAKGDGKTNDHAAFQKAAAFFNERGGNGKLVISKGTYLVGHQVFNAHTTSKPVYEGSDVLGLKGVKNLTIEGRDGAVLRYVKGLRYGAFEPATGKPYMHGNNYFVNYAYLGFVGNAIALNNCSNVVVSNLELDGNNGELMTGGVFGDVGLQVPHMGLFIVNSTRITVDKIHAHHFGLDGIQVSNNTGDKKEPDRIVLQNSRFEYNGRQGLSWVGGNDLTAVGCSFNHTGKGKISSAPGAGVDIEAEVGPIRNGKFVRCEFINNTGCGLVAETGPSSHCTFTDCVFWGTTSWSVWINKPGFIVANSKIYGAIVHGYDAKTDAEATRFIDCHFEDKPYNGKEPFGRFLVESNGIRRLTFENCTLVANKKKLMWLETDYKLKPEEKYQLINSRLLFLGGQPPADNWVAVLRSVHMKNTTFEIKHPKAADYYFNGLGEPFNANGGGNKHVRNGVAVKL